MPFVKLDCEIRSSSLWMDCPPEARLVFITMLTMAEPFVLEEPAQQLPVDSLQPTGRMVPAGEYGMTRATSPAITRESNLPRADVESALRILESPDHKSRSQAFEGRRVARVDGGYLVLNYAAYRERDYTAAARMRRHRAKKKANGDDVTRNVTPGYASQKSEVRSQKSEVILPKQAKGSSSTAQLRQDLLEVVAQLVKLEGQPDQTIVKRLTATNSNGKGAKKLSVEALMQYCARKGNFEWASVALDNGRSRLAELERETELETAATTDPEPVDLGPRFPEDS